MTVRPFAIDRELAPDRPNAARGPRNGHAKAVSGQTRPPEWRSITTDAAGRAEPEPVAPPSHPVEPFARRRLAFDEADLARAAAAAAALGRRHGLDEAEADQRERETQALEAIARQIQEVEAAMTAMAERAREQLTAILYAAIDVVAAEALARHALPDIENLVMRCLDHLKSPMRVEIRVAEALAAPLEARLGELEAASGFAGRIEIVPAPLEPGAVEIRWQDGHAARSPDRILEAVKEQLTSMLDTPVPSASEAGSADERRASHPPTED